MSAKYRELCQILLGFCNFGFSALRLSLRRQFVSR
jgi:hypothetical protein